MSLPSKQQQIAAVAKFLDSERNEDRTLEEVAKDIVEGYLDALVRDLKKPATPLRQGMLFKMPTDNKVRRVAHLKDGLLWVVSETDSYGWLGYDTNPLWSQCEEHTPKTYKVIDSKRKLLEMTDEEIEDAWSNPDWKVGDKVSTGQRQHIYEVIATGPKSVLLREEGTGCLHADDNSNMSRFYRREVKMGDIEW